ncbi:MAG: serine/threonine protein kinase, partial [Nocardioides sp.]|nr:serine/threonine protein kinase [Nocardioides sp.]
MSGSSPTPPAGNYDNLGIDLGPGTRIGGFRVESRLGAGAMGAVYRADEEALGRSVALKVLPPQMAWDEAFRERFIRESRTASAVDHPNIIPIYAAGQESGVLYLAMRYVPGGDLHGMIQRTGPMSAEQAMTVLAPVASALDAAHAAGIVHRDVKPANILIDRVADGSLHPYLSDFGLATAAQLPGLTAAGLFLGTAAYAAPEQLSGHQVGPAADQYSLACVIHQVLTGEMPFRGDSAPAQMVARMDGVPSIRQVRTDLSPRIDDVMAVGLSWDPADRYASCRELVAALGEVLGGTAREISEIHLGVEVRVGDRSYRGGGPLHPSGGRLRSFTPGPRSTTPPTRQPITWRRRL